MSRFTSYIDWPDQGLTRDNTLLSRPKKCWETESRPIDEEVQRYINASVSENTKRAYHFDLEHFKAWGGSLPSTAEEVARYLAIHASILAPATLARRIATLSKLHSVNFWQNPCRSDVVQNTLKGIKRVTGTAQRQARPLLREDLFLVLDNLTQTTRCIRDRALILLGWAGGMRASELVGLNVADVEIVREGLVLHLLRSKTDQEGQGRKIGIPFGRTRHCPVGAFMDWSNILPVGKIAIFYPMDRHGVMGTKRLRADAVSLILRNQLHRAGLSTKDFSGHSLRAGLATSAIKVGASAHKVRQQTGHASDAMLSRYIRDAVLFEDNVVGNLL
jgi:site-specific recombinase XerD